MPAQSLIRIYRDLAVELEPLGFGPPVTHVLNPLIYARAPHEQYLERFATAAPEALFLGTNPGPFGMMQIGIPFGEIKAARDWMGIDAPIALPATAHPRRPIEGWSTTRSEVSGRRLWGWAASRFGTPAAFFKRFFVLNYCPLAFLEQSGKNRTPDKLPADERDPLFAICDRALARVVDALKPRLLIGVGGFAEKRAQIALADRGVAIASVLHPSPASPAANRGWVNQVERQLVALGVKL